MKPWLALLLLGACAPRVPATPERAAELWLGGDVFLGKSPAGVLAQLRRSGVGIVNLEGPIGPEPAPTGGPLRLLQAPEALQELKAAGVRVATVANNHALDAGPEGLAATVQAIQRAGLRAAGGPAGFAVIQEGKLRIAVTTHDLTGGVPARLESELAKARAAGDVLVSTFHVTGPPLYLPRPELTRAVEIALKAGASVIASHGTHALGPVERRGGVIIAWGLGNVAFACDCTDEQDAALLEVRWDGPVPSAAIVPIEAGLKGKQPRLAREPEPIFELLEAIGSPALRREGARGFF